MTPTSQARKQRLLRFVDYCQCTPDYQRNWQDERCGLNRWCRDYLYLRGCGERDTFILQQRLGATGPQGWATRILKEHQTCSPWQSYLSLYLWDKYHV